MKKILILSLAAVSLLVGGCNNQSKILVDPKVNARTECRDEVIANYKDQSIAYTIEDAYVTKKANDSQYSFIITVYLNLYFDKWGCAYYKDEAHCEWLGRFANSTGEGRPF